MIAIADMMWGGVLPALVAATAMTIAWRLTGNSGLGWLLGITFGFLAGFWGLDGQGVGFAAALAKAARPLEARDWLPIAVLSAAAIELIGMWRHSPTWLAWLLRGAWCSFLPWRLLSGSVYLPAAQPNPVFSTGAWSTGQALGWLGGASLLLALTWLVTRLMPAQDQPRLRASLTSLVALGATMTIALSGSLTVAQLLGVLTAALVGCGMVSAVLRFDRGPEAAAGPLLAVFGGVLVIAKFLLSPELSLFATLMLLLALVAALGWIDPPARLTKRGQTLVRIVVCAAALAMTVIPAARDFAASQAERSENPYLNWEP